MSSYAHNESEMLTFEDERSLKMKVPTVSCIVRNFFLLFFSWQIDAFLSRYPRGCVAVYGVELDASSEKCRNAESFGRLKAIRGNLGKPNYDVELNKSTMYQGSP